MKFHLTWVYAEAFHGPGTAWFVVTVGIFVEIGLAVVKIAVWRPTICSLFRGWSTCSRFAVGLCCYPFAIGTASDLYVTCLALSY